MKRAVLLAIGALALLGVGVGVGKAISHRPPVVEIVQPHTGPAVQAVYATGTVEPTVSVPIAPRIGARLQELQADEGSRVKQGQVLARLEDQDAKSNLNQLVAREEFARLAYQRAQKLVKQSITSREAADQALSDWNAAKAATEQARAQLGFLQLTAPADGTIIQRDGEVGQLIPANEPVFWLACCAPLRVTAEVDEEDIPLVQPGQEVLVRTDAFPGKVFNATVAAITPRGDAVQRTYRVRMALPEDTPLLIGMTAETNIIVRETGNGLLLPVNALQGDKVQVVDGEQRVKAITVTTGARGPETVEIRDGLPRDARVVVPFDNTLKDGDRVRASGHGEE